MMYDQPHNDFDEHEHGEDASSAAFDKERELETIKEDMARQGEAWQGMVRHGKVGLGLVGRGLVG